MVRAAAYLTWVAAALASVAALSGLLIDGIYVGAASAAEMFRGFDLVTAVVAVPVLAIATRVAQQQGSVRAKLVTTSVVAYLVYTYALYLFGTGFNDLFLVHAAVFATGLGALILTIATIDVAEVADRLDAARTRLRSVAVLLGLLGVGLGAMWVYSAVNYVVTGDVPVGSALVETDTIVHVGMALDLTLLVPLYSVAAVLLWRMAPWGLVLAAVALFAGILHQVSYMVAMPFQKAAGVAGAVSFDAAEPVIVLLYVLATALLVHESGRSLQEASDETVRSTSWAR
jgi:hypothetical protein